MLLSTSSWRAIVLLVSAGVGLLLASLVLVGRDLSFVRDEAEANLVGLAEAGALALQFAPDVEIQPYLTSLVKHPEITTATVYSSQGQRMTAAREPGRGSPLMKRIVPSLSEPLVACRASGPWTLCVEGDRSYFESRLAALVVPHALLLAASGILLIVTIFLARGSNRRQMAELASIVRTAAEEKNFTVRAPVAPGESGALAQALNKLLEEAHQRDLILRRRTTELETANRELEAFSYSVSHDLRSPLASVDGFSQALEEFYSDRFDESGREYLRWIRDAVDQMNDLVAGLLQMSRITRAELHRAPVNLSQIAHSIAEALRQKDPSRSVEFRIDDHLIVEGDERLLHAVLENLMSNAFKFTRKRENAIITVGTAFEGGRRAFFVRDNGAGFDSTQAAKMFTPFQRLHSASEFEGTGIGLATVKRIVERHGGSIWADGEVDAGATFYFTLSEAGTRSETERAITTVSS